jgi:hypothetical protein
MAVFSVTDDATGKVVSAAWIIFRPGTDFGYLAGGSTPGAASQGSLTRESR